MPVQPLSVILVEDDEDLRESTKDFLLCCGYQVTAVANGRSFYRALDEGEFSVAIIDIGLPDQSGLVLAEYLKTNSTTGVIVLTARDTEDDQVKGYEAGADLYLTKPINTKVLASAVSSLAERLNGKFCENAPVKATTPAGRWILLKEKWALMSPDSQLIELTSLEFRFLELLARADNRQLKRDQLFSHLYQQPDSCSDRVLDALVRRLRTKMQCLPVPINPIKSIYGVGYCFVEPLLIK